ncbi:hypothetical protein BU17DRAFT_61932 [Hysterangium stoloniferum]|nr:hypothetical protein BU17DRAFT_61932 [Hysterangium stoloniferum]
MLSAIILASLLFATAQADKRGLTWTFLYSCQLKGTYEKFCYIACRDAIDTQSPSALEEALPCFYYYRIIFEECGLSLCCPDVEEECTNTGIKLKEKEDDDGEDVIRLSILAEVALAKIPTAVVTVVEPNFVNKLHLFTADQIDADSYSNILPTDDSDEQHPKTDNLIILCPQ